MTTTIDRARQRFEEAIAALEQRVRLRGTATYRDLSPDEHARAFTVAGAMKADLLADLREAVRRAVEDGVTLDMFRKDFWSTVKKHGWHGWTGEGTSDGEAWRTRVIYTTNIRKSYSAGRYAQLTDPEYLKEYPNWEWVHSGLAMDPRPQHAAWNGMVLPHDHPFWASHFPPRIPPDYGCTCRVKASRSRNGVQSVPPEGWEDQAAPGEGSTRANVAADIRDLVESKRARLPVQLGDALAAAISKEMESRPWQ